jgi:sulfite reductase alpha subunit-like flavoprotein
MLMIGNGSGFGPMMAVVRAALRHDHTGPIHL